jgi:DNA-binding beta-propeller fold protein YncE
MKMKSYLWLLAFSTALVFQRCSDDDGGKTAPTVVTGVLVANEGNFQAANASVTYYDPEKDSVAQNIFRNAAGDFAGDVLQSITLDGERAYLVLNNSNTIEVANSTTFAREKTLADAKIVQPRYVSVINGKAYISVMGPYDEDYNLTSSSIVVADANTMNITTTIPTKPGVDDLFYTGGYLFASINNFGAEATVSVIDPSKNEVIKDLAVMYGPSGMVLDANNRLWVVCRGDYEAEDSYLESIDVKNLGQETQIHLDFRAGADLAVSPDGRTLYFTGGNNIYSMPIDSKEAPTAPLFTAEDVADLSSFAVNPQNGDFYVGDARFFLASGGVFVYGSDGTSKTSFTAGVGPTQFIFKE